MTIYYKTRLLSEVTAGNLWLKLSVYKNHSLQILTPQKSHR
jgi:hypothetical protein